MNVSRPLIGITRSAKRGNTMTWLNRLAVWRAGGRSVVLTPGEDRSFDGLDGILVGGGDDIAPTLYNGEVQMDVRIDEARDRLELRALEFATKRDLPVMGICRGSQMLNVFFKGSMHQEAYEVHNAPNRRTVLARKHITTTGGSKLNALLRCDKCRVNSLHHQAVDAPGNGLSISARDEHGIVQAIENPEKNFLVGVQWHPEMLIFDRGQQRLFRGLVSAAKGEEALAD